MTTKTQSLPSIELPNNLIIHFDELPNGDVEVTLKVRTKIYHLEQETNPTHYAKFTIPQNRRDIIASFLKPE